MSKRGIVYCLSNPSFRNNIYKVGMTKHVTKPQKRLLSLDVTSTPTPFRFEFYIIVTNRYKAEKIIHEKLKLYRIRNCREYFKLDKMKLKQIFKTIKGKIIDDEDDEYDEDDEDDEDENLLNDMFVVEKIKNHTKGLPVKETKYQVKWKGYKKTTWEPYKNLKHLTLLYKYILKKQL